MDWHESVVIPDEHLQYQDECIEILILFQTIRMVTRSDFNLQDQSAFCVATTTI